MEGEVIMLAIIHPMCPTEEYASKGRKWDWFIPPRPPTSAPIIPKKGSIGLFHERENKRHIGAIFCQVIRRSEGNHEILFITEGNHIWKGAAPNFVIKAKGIRK